MISCSASDLVVSDAIGEDFKAYEVRLETEDTARGGLSFNES